MSRDAVENIVAMIHAAAPELAPQRLREIAMRIRRDMERKRHYLAWRERRESPLRDAAECGATSAGGDAVGARR